VATLNIDGPKRGIGIEGIGSLRLIVLGVTRILQLGGCDHGVGLRCSVSSCSSERALNSGRISGTQLERIGPLLLSALVRCRGRSDDRQFDSCRKGLRPHAMTK